SDIRDENPVPFTSGSVASIGKGFIYGDNDTDFDKLSEEDKAGISFELVPSPGCEIKYSRVKVYAVIHNLINAKNQVIWQNGGKYGFGGYVNDDLNVRVHDPAATQNQSPGGGWGQFFPKGVVGFRGNLAGTNYFAESKQKLWTVTDLIDIGVLSESLSALAIDTLRTLRFGERVVVQEFDFGFIPCGEYLFRTVGHSDTENLETTSTFYLCTTSWNGYKQNGVISRGDYIKEIYIDTSSGNDYDGLLDDKVAVILDLSAHEGDIVCSISGYLYEDKINRQPIELAEVSQSIRVNPTYFQHCKYTDHNGFYFGVASGEHYMILKGYNRCVPNSILGQTLSSFWSNGRIERTQFATETYPNYVTDLCNRYIITGTIKECGLTSGIAGIPIILGRSKPVYSNSTGEFRVVAHFNQSRGSDMMILSIGPCTIMDCNCRPLKISLGVTQPLCGVPGCLQSIISVGNFNVKSITRKGFEHGSVVPIGVQAADSLGRHTDIQDVDSWSVNIPTEQEQGNSSYQRIKVNLPPSFSDRFRKAFKYLTFFFGKNIAYEDFFEWAADKVEFIDSAGIVNAANPAKVKIWYRGLNEYNLLRGFKTNTTWKILDSSGNSRVGDIVEFIQNADGIYLPVGLTGIIQYDKDGAYFLVDYDPAFRALKDGVRFKFKRQYLCETPRAYYEHSFTINFCGGDGIPRDDEGNIVTSFFLDGFTAYMLPRQIPVITDVIENVPATGGGTQEKITQKKEVKVYPFSFEHHSPSDTWG
ncbi:MAG TPA: hypothetical protein PLD02_14515, partial [Saprospiraceae bacterium]|nr:hypothetical protein [Saprospiraceae bacterium]